MHPARYNRDVLTPITPNRPVPMLGYDIIEIFGSHQSLASVGSDVAII